MSLNVEDAEKLITYNETDDTTTKNSTAPDGVGEFENADENIVDLKIRTETLKELIPMFDGGD